MTQDESLAQPEAPPQSGETSQVQTEAPSGVQTQEYPPPSGPAVSAPNPAQSQIPPYQPPAQVPLQVPAQVPLQPPHQTISQYQTYGQQLPAILECRDLVKNYGVMPALGQVSFNVYPGRIVGLLGPNGSGKTTLIKTVAGLLTPSYGSVKICGYDPGVESKALVSYLPERTYLGSWMKVSDAIDYFESFYADFSRARALDMLARLQVPLGAHIKKLSKGTKEKVQLILVMARQAKLYLLDEPIAGVDPAARDYILDTIISNYDRNASIIISTHLIADVENTLDDFVFINRGQIVASNAVSAVREAGWPSLDAYFREAFRC